MTARTRHPNRTAALIGVVLVLVVAAVLAVAVLASGAPAPAATTGAPVAAGTPAAAPSVAPVSTPSPSAVPESTATPEAPAPTAAAAGRPTPQPTRAAVISRPVAVPISDRLSATVVRMEAVQGAAEGPGEIAGPSVRFTIRITNRTGAAFALSNTVVNAYAGASAAPAVQLRQPGAKDFPASVANGESATGVFVFNIPEASRSKVEVTVDTSVRNPVIAFKGAAPRG